MDAFATTGQGLLGNNTFTYCLNNPICFADPSGLCTYVAYEPWRSPDGKPYIDCMLPDCEKSKYYVKNKSIRKVVQVGNAVMKNLELGYAVGLGLHWSSTFLDFLDVSGGIRYDLMYVGYADGDIFCQQAYYEGVEVWIVKMFGFDIHPSQQIRDNPISGTNSDWREDPAQDSWTLYEIGGYIGAGGRLRIGFDGISFFEELDSIFS